MSDSLIPMYKAAEILGTSKMAVGRWIRAGILTPVHANRSIKLYESEVTKLKEFRDRGIKPMLIGEELLMLKYKMMKIEKLYEDVCDTLRIPSKMVSFSDAELNYWYEAAIHVVRAKDIRAATFNFQNWKHILQNMQEEEFKRLKHLRRDPVPFVPFILLCERIISFSKLNKNKQNRSSLRYSDWINIYLLLRNLLRDRAISFTITEPPDVDPIKQVDIAVSSANLEPIREEVKSKIFG